MEKLIVPLQINSGNLTDQWRLWRQKFENYLIASETNNKSEEVQCAQLLHFLGDDALQIYNSFSLTASERNKVKTLLQKFEEYFIPKKNLTYERYKFFNLHQGANETIEQFVTELRNQAKLCEFANLNDDLIKTMLITGLRDAILREKLLQNQEKTLHTVIEACIIWENTKIQNEEIKTAGSNLAEINAVSYNKKSKSHIPKRSNSFHNSKSVDYYKGRPSYKITQDRRPSKLNNFNNSCMKCGKSHRRGDCPAYGKTCAVCKKLNHFGYMCRNKNRKSDNRNVCEITGDHNPDDQDFSRLSINWLGSCTNRSWQVDLIIRGKKLSFKVDTGSDVNVLNLEALNSLKIDKKMIKMTDQKLYDYNDMEIPVIGKCSILTKYNNIDYNIDYFIVGKCYKLIIGLATSEMLGLINRTNNIKWEKDYESLINKNKNLFNGIGELGQPYKIEIKEDAKPVIQPIRKIPFALQNQFKEYLIELEKLNIIERVEGSSEWLNSFVIVKKTDGSLRICLDPKDLNKIIKTQKYKIPTIDDIAIKLKGSKYYTTLDATSGFWNIPLDEASSKLCTFGTPFGRYRFKRMPFGITSASEVFQERFKEIFDMEGVEIYIDDILIHGKTKEEHDRRLKQVFEKAKICNIKFNLNKCKFGMKEIKYLGYKLSENGIKIDDEKLKAITQMPTPTNKKELQRFLGLVTYVGRFIDNLSEKTAALRKILKGDSIFMWNTEQQIAFEDLKKNTN